MATTYAIHSTVRGRHNRTQRAMAPAHFRLQQRVGADQARLVRGRPLIITEDKLLRDLEELKRKQKQGILEIRTADGRRFDLESLQPVPMAAPTPLPNPPLDSAANDVPAGQPMPTFEGGKPLQSLPEVQPEEPPIDIPVEIPADFLPDADDVDSGRTAAKNKVPGKGSRR